MANQKTSSRSRRKAKKPTVIEATATELEAEAADQAPEAGSADGTMAANEQANPSGAGTTPQSEPDIGGDGTQPVSNSSTEHNKEEQGPRNAEENGQSPTMPTHTGGKANWIAAGMSAVLLAGIAGGGYLYRTYGDRLFAPQQPAADLAAIESQVMDAAGAAQSARQAAGETSAQLGSLAERISGLEQKLAAATAASEQGMAATGAVEAIQTRTTNLEQQAGELRSFIEQLQQALNSAASSDGGVDQAAINLKLEEFSSRLAALEALPSGTDQDSSAEITALKQQLTDSNEQIAALTAALETITSDVQSLSERSTQIEDALAATPDAMGSSAAIARTGKAIAALASAVNAGGPYEAELAALREVAPAAPALPALDANAGSGITTMTMLRQQLAELIPVLKEAGRTDETASPGFMASLQQKLSSVVQVRSLDTPDWPDVATRALAAFDNAGPEAALAALPVNTDTMPDQLKNWLIEARKRISATGELDSLPQQLLSSPAGQAQ